MADQNQNQSSLAQQLIDQLFQLNQRLNQFNEKHDQTDVKITQTNDLLTTLKQEQDESNARTNDLLTTLKQKLEESDVKATVANNLLNALTRRLNTMEVNLTSRLVTLEDQIKRLVAQNTTMNARLNSVQERLTEVTEIKQQLGTIYREINTRFTGMEEQFDEMNREVARMNNVRFNMLVRLSKLEEQLEVAETQLLRVDANILANAAKFYNKTYIDMHAGRSTLYIPVVKYKAGHPWNEPPIGATTIFTQVLLELDNSYPVGSYPPEGIVPASPKEIDDMSRFEHARLRECLRMVFWFYNDERLNLESDTSHAGAIACLEKLEHLFTRP